jgi:hypothetical protein
MWFGSPTIQAKGANFQHANPPHSGSNVFMGVAPCLERGGIQIRILCAVFV